MSADWWKASGFIAILAVALSGSLHWALYYPPPSHLPSIQQRESHPRQSEQAKPGKPQGTQTNPVIVKVLPPTPGTPEAAKDEQERHQKAAIERGLLWFTAVLAVATIGLMIATVGLAAFTKRQALDSNTIQRAYVKMSHFPIGLTFPTEDKMSVTMQVKNWGATPARITDTLLVSARLPKDSPLAVTPTFPKTPRSDNERHKAFLVREDEYAFTQSIAERPDRIVKIRSGENRFYIYGYVDYIDAFGIRHRSGYGRVFAPELDGSQSNLAFILNEAYNYDRRRARGEGLDWDEPEGPS